MDWTNSGELLAVAGKFREIAVKSNHTIRYINVLHFYNDTGQMVYKIKIPCETVRANIILCISKLLYSLFRLGIFMDVILDICCLKSNILYFL